MESAGCFYQILNLKYNLNTGLSPELFNLLDLSGFKAIVLRPAFALPVMLPQQWIAGFVSGDGSFFIHIGKDSKYKTGYRVDPSFTIGLHVRDKAILELLAKQLNCGSISASAEVAQYSVRKLSSITEVIIPLFNSYLVQGVKSLDFLDFCRVICLIQKKEHLTEKGLEQIQTINSGMNQRRST